MTKFRTYYGFPIRWPNEAGIPIENEFLFGLYERHFSTSEASNANLASYYYKAEEKEYPNHIDPRVASKELSHDQITAYISYAFIKDLKHHVKDIATGIALFSYFDLAQREERNGHPRDYIYCKLLSKELSGFLLLPLFYLICAFSMLIGYRVVKGDGKYKIEPKLSGELLWCLRVLTVQDDKLLRACMLPCKLLIKLGAYLRFGGVKNMIKRYFQDNEEHPIIKNMKETIL